MNTPTPKPLHTLSPEELKAFFLANPDHLTKLCEGLAGLGQAAALAVSAFTLLAESAEKLQQVATQPVIFRE